MLEVRYHTQTKEVTGWCGDPNQFGNLKDRGNEAIVTLNIPIPDKSLEGWLYDGQGLIPNPNYTEPKPPRDFTAEIDKIKVRLEELEYK